MVRRYLRIIRRYLILAAELVRKVQRVVQAFSDRIIRRPPPPSDDPTLAQKCPQRLQTATSSLWAIYMASPGDFGVAGDLRHLIHIEEQLQAIQREN